MCFTEIGIPILMIYKTAVKITKVTDAPRAESMSRPCCIRVVFAFCPYQIRVTLSSHSYRIRGHDYLSVPVNVCPYDIRTASVSCPCHILAISVCEFAQGYATDVTRI